MDKAYDHTKYEADIYKKWEASGAFKGKKGKKPYTILMPPPNANASLHAGHAMYTVDDILVRWKRMQGYSAQWVPGTDHAGFETQYVYEKHLAKDGKSRMDFDRKTLYDNVYSFVKENSGLIFEQMKRLGFSANWERSVFTLDKHVLGQVFNTFKKMESEGLVYRDEYIVNYCTYCGTSLAELEIKYVERKDTLYYMKYGPFTLATVRPETKFGDTALAVNPKDERYRSYVGKEISADGLNGKFYIKVIADEHVDPEFGTGVVKVTPAHDPNDFQIWQRHKDEIPGPKRVISYDGRLNELAGKYEGLYVNKARKIIVEDLERKGLLEKVDEDYVHSVATCYKCGHVIEPLTVPNWFIKVAELKKKVIATVNNDGVRFHPKRFKRIMLQWLEVMHDWPISRQIVWGIQIPAWYNIDDNPDIMITTLIDGKVAIGRVSELVKKYSLEEIKTGLQSLQASAKATYVVSETPPGERYIQETDTFDTWFSSGQWPLVTGVTLPTDTIGTLHEILKFWISRMIMFSLYLKNEVPFNDVYLWAMVADKKGIKMSKSKGNVINPIELVDKYGADALRISLIYGTPAGSKVILSEDKVRGMRNFSNKIWNAARFINMNLGKNPQNSKVDNTKAFEKELKQIINDTTEHLKKFRLDKASELLYDKFWHWFCDVCIEENKSGKISDEALTKGLQIFLKLLHPFVPFVTEAAWNEMGFPELLINSEWPEAQ